MGRGAERCVVFGGYPEAQTALKDGLVFAFVPNDIVFFGRNTSYEAEG